MTCSVDEVQLVGFGLFAPYWCWIVGNFKATLTKFRSVLKSNRLRGCKKSEGF